MMVTGRRVAAYSLWLLTGVGILLAASPGAVPTATPTPRPKLSGGFGRSPATPVAAEGLATGTGSGTGQSLADAVRAASEAKQRKEQKSSVSITNQNLITDPSKGRLTTASPRTPVAPAPVAPARTGPLLSGPASTEAGEAEWRERMRSARKRVEELKEHVPQLEAESRKLENDFYAWDDGQYRDGVIKPAWDKKKGELEAAKKQLAEAEKELAELPEKARKAGALPGWLRE